MPLDVFLVDDSAPVRERLHAMLAALAGVCVVGQAEGAEQAIAAILDCRPQVVLLDLKLGDGGSGFDVLRAVHPQAPEIDFYLLSNFSTPAYRRSAEELGARGFFDKTQEFGRLMDLLAERARRAP
ncbi:MAG TPA: response regulator transcription factor [Burkholderiales bacterium]|nr:response regulator transcription factor [Burkholderiales bacterium]